VATWFTLRQAARVACLRKPVNSNVRPHHERHDTQFALFFIRWEQRGMKHAGSATLDSLRELLAGLRALPGLIEKKPGIFYVKSRAYLHFHEDPAGVFADARLSGDEFERFPVNTKREQESLLKSVAKNRAT